MTECEAVMASGEALSSAVRLLAVQKARLIPVVDSNGSTAGVVSAASIVSAAFASADKGVYAGPGGLAGFISREAGRPVDDFMDRDFITVAPEAGIQVISSIFSGKAVSTVLVVDHAKRPLGIIQPTDVLKRLCEYSERKKR
ncbi:MAG: CBS domain-containing protein [Deltaproteobacteria bacterium]|nr:CBS domain-containing protein [Deltaproteobacteria bacterium]